jgi:hypothetical protein
MAAKLKLYGPLVIAIGLLWLVLFLSINASLALNEGNLVYALDDAYIHVAMAKNFSQHGVWGVTSHEFSSTSSSLLWTLLLSGLFAIFGVNEAIPLLINFFSAAVLLVLIYYFLQEFKFSFWSQTLMLISFILFIPLPYLVLGGLEHVLQIVIFLGYLYIAASGTTWQQDSRSHSIKKLIPLFLMALLTVMVRYEGLFIVFAVSLLLLIRKRLFISLINAASGLLPAVVYGVISISKGWYFLPNSVLLKGTRPDITSFGKIVEFIYGGLRQMVYNVHLLVLLICVLAVLWLVHKKHRGLWGCPGIMGMVFVVIFACQMFFSESGYFMNRYPWIRYDSYLVAVGLFVVFTGVGYLTERREGEQRKDFAGISIVVFLIFVMALPLAERGVRTSVKVVRAAANIYGQQYQMGRFMQKYYPGETAAVNDIGAVCFLGNIRCFDVWGLATKEVGDLQLNKTFTAANIEEAARRSGARVAVVYDQFFRLVGIDADLPRSWIKVGEWRIPDNVVCVRDTVSFFALNESEAAFLAANLRDFVPSLPKEVKYRTI